MRQRVESRPTSLARGEDYILYSILDFIVDNYAPVVEAVQSEVDALEDGLLSKALPESAINRLYTLRRELLKLRWAVASATSATISAASRRTSTRCARCWPSPSRRA